MGGGRYEDTEFGRAFFPDGPYPIRNGGFGLEFEGTGVILRLFGSRPQPNEAEALTSDQEAVASVWLPREAFEALPSSLQTVIDGWPR